MQYYDLLNSRYVTFDSNATWRCYVNVGDENIEIENPYFLVYDEKYFITRDHNITEEVLVWMLDNDINPNYKEWTDSEKVMFKLAFT